MASIQSLLNPLPEIPRFPLQSPTSLTSSSSATSRAPRPKKPKIAKDAPIFNKGKIRGELRYAPCEERDEELTKWHQEFQIHPMGDIAAYPRHIPYNSDKKSFQERTGRESFEVFQYTFKMPGEDRQWTVMWDYNIGLVRLTHLFKCMDYSKTTPAKMLNANPGLREICHSITGGALAAQGYWMPFEAAKAVAATFCWNIRFALTPLFGVDFPSICVNPQNKHRYGGYGRWTIDSEIVRLSTEKANYYRTLELQSLSGCTPRRPSPEGPIFKKRVLAKNHEYADSVSSGYGSSYSSPEFGTDAYCTSPMSPYRNTFTPVNTPRSTDVEYTRVPSPRHVLASISNMPIPDKRSSDEYSRSDSESTIYSDLSSTATDNLSADIEMTDNGNDSDEDYRDVDIHGQTPFSSRSEPKREIETRSRGEPRSVLFAREVKAAHALLSLHMQEAAVSDVEDGRWGERVGRKRRRASA